MAGEVTICRRCACWGRVGEPINPEAWMWYHKNIGDKNCPDRRHVVADGNRRHHDHAAARRDRHQARQRDASVLRHRRGRVWTTRAKKSKAGYLAIRKPWPGMLRGVYGDPERYQKTYWSKWPGVYFPGDGARKDKDGYFWIVGRVDDVVNVAGHRIGTAELESIFVEHPRVAESAVIGVAHELKGQAMVAFVSLQATASRGRRSSRRNSRNGSRRRSASSRSPTASCLRATCRRRARAKSCDASCATSPKAAHWAT